MGCSSSIDNEVKISKLKVAGSPEENNTTTSQVQQELKPTKRTAELGTMRYLDNNT